MRAHRSGPSRWHVVNDDGSMATDPTGLPLAAYGSIEEANAAISQADVAHRSPERLTDRTRQ